jgi:hypothetical protein
MSRYFKQLVFNLTPVDQLLAIHIEDGRLLGRQQLQGNILRFCRAWFREGRLTQ